MKPYTRPSKFELDEQDFTIARYGILVLMFMLLSIVFFLDVRIRAEYLRYVPFLAVIVVFVSALVARLDDGWVTSLIALLTGLSGYLTLVYSVNLLLPQLLLPVVMSSILTFVLFLLIYQIFWQVKPLFLAIFLAIPLSFIAGSSLVHGGLDLPAIRAQLNWLTIVIYVGLVLMLVSALRRSDQQPYTPDNLIDFAIEMVLGDFDAILGLARRLARKIVWVVLRLTYRGGS